VTVGPVRRHSLGRWRLHSQRGFGVFFAFVLIAGLAATSGLLAFYRNDPVQAQNERKTEDVLAQAKAALIAYAVRQGSETGNARPGDLPCPASDEKGEARISCNNPEERLGRLPWKTLGIPEPVDSAGETLWYALSEHFRSWNGPGAMPINRQINSDTRGNLIVNAADGSILTYAAVAVIFAPGASIGGQHRGESNQVNCLAGQYPEPKKCPNAYLEAATGINQPGSLSGPFTMAARSDTANDTLIYLDTSELIPAVEMRVGNELKRLLERYRENAPCKCYPWADTWPILYGEADIGQNRGRFPKTAYPYNWGYNAGKIPRLPQWVDHNEWYNLVWYSVSKQNTDEDETCRTCAADVLSVDGLPVSALIMTPGTPDIPPTTKPEDAGKLTRLTSAGRRNVIEHYFEKAANEHRTVFLKCPDTGEIGGSAGGSLPPADPTCDRYTVPDDKRFNRDRLFPIAVGTPGSKGTCAVNSRTLLDNVECGGPGNSIKSICEKAVQNLGACTCMAAAKTLTRPPCTNNTNSPKCEAAISQLEACIK
jgi:hypothetical protein